jgi:hypothetical protein
MRAFGYATAVVAMAMLSGCNGPERNAITDTAPFFQTTAPFHEDRIDDVIAGARGFSTRHHMDFLLARKTLFPGEFNVSANSPSLNLHALRSSAIDSDKVQIFAIARGTPTPEDKALVDEFVAQIRQRNGGA